jgi:assimilatory nitrate reductase catalytic subunit
MTSAPAIASTCPYCGVGCGVLARTEAAHTRIEGDPEHPANFGRLCSKGTALGETLGLDGRLLQAEIEGQPVALAAALDAVARGFAECIEQHGPDSVALYVSGQLLTEDYYAANKLMKGFVGSANIDTNSRLCMSSTVAGQLRGFGSDTVPGCYEDIELADLVILVGSNLAWCHPVLYQRLRIAKEARPQLRVVVVDPRRTPSCEIADLHLPIAADADALLFAGLLGALARVEALDRAYLRAHVEDPQAALAQATALSLAEVAARCGLSMTALQRLVGWLKASPRTVTLFSQGVNQSRRGTDKVSAILNLHLATGRIGKPGSGPFSLTGQPNAMGGREVGGLASLLAAHMRIDSAEDRVRLQRFWNAPRMAAKPGLKAVDLFHALEDGRIRALWVIGTNPAVSMPEARRVEAALARCPLLVVSEVMRDTDTARHARIRLPALAWGEKSGTVTNSERRISRQRAFLPAPGDARADWWLIAQVARRLGWGEAFGWNSAGEVFAEHAALSGLDNAGRRDFDISAWADCSAAEYEAMQPFQWPARHARSGDAARLFGEGGFFTGNGKARLLRLDLDALAEVESDPRYPLELNSGRVRGHRPDAARHRARPDAARGSARCRCGSKAASARSMYAPC